MKIINFINPVDPDIIHSGKIWFKSTLILLCMIFVIIAYMQILQIRAWLLCRYEYNRYDTIAKQCAQTIEEHKKLLAREQKFKNYLNTIIDLHEQCNKQIEQLNLLRTICTQDIYLVSCSFSSGNIDITLNCNTIEQVQQCCTIFNQSSRGVRMHIASIVPEKRVLRVTFKNC